MSLRNAWFGPAPGGDGTVASLPIPVVSRPSGAASDDAAIQAEVTALFAEFRTPLLRYLLSIGLGVADSEDVVQETFLALFRHLRLGRPRTNLKGWLFRTAHNLGLKSRRLAGRARRRSAIGPASGPILDGAPDPEERLSQRQRYEAMCAALDALPARVRNCVSLRAEGLRYREIALVLSISLGTVSNCMRRAAVALERAHE